MVTRRGLVSGSRQGWGKAGVVMEQDATSSDSRTRLVDAARALLARGEDRFSITRLCAEAGVARDVFRGAGGAVRAANRRP